MKQEDFEHHMRKKGSGFRLEPREDVWERITQELDARPKRRPAIFWWLLPALMVVAGLAGYRWWFTPNAADEKTVSPLAKTISGEAENNKLNSVIKASVKRGKEEERKDPAPKQNISTNKKNGISISILTEKKQAITSLSDQDFFLLTEMSGNEMTTSSEQSQASASSSIIHTKFYSRDSIQETDSTSSPGNISSLQRALPSIISVSRISLGLGRSITGPLPLEAGSVQPGSLKKFRKTRWEMMAGGGLSGITENTGLSGNQPVFEYNSPGNSSGGLNSGSSRNGAARAPAASLTWELGISRYQMLHPKWEWEAGAGYQYLSATQYTGERKDSLYNFSLGNARQNTSDHYYVPGNSAEHTARSHRVFVHAGMARLFDIGRNRLSAEAGIRTGLNVSDRFLVRSENGRHFLPGNGNASSLFLGTSIGLNFRNRQNWGAGFHWGTDFTPVYPPGRHEKIHWQYARFQLMVPIR